MVTAANQQGATCSLHGAGVTWVEGFSRGLLAVATLHRCSCSQQGHRGRGEQGPFSPLLHSNPALAHQNHFNDEVFLVGTLQPVVFWNEDRETQARGWGG